MSYRYETHMHTAEGSRCARATAEEQVRYYKDMGFDGICVTDHFLGGNTTVPPELTWKRKIEMFCAPYEKAAEAGEKLGLKVFFGWEYADKGTDFLTYGLDKEWLLRNEGLLLMSITNYLDFVRREGAFVAHAHPFREDFYIPCIQLMPRQVDAVEIVNANRKDFENYRAAEYARNYGLPALAGSDNHTAEKQKRLCGIETDAPIQDASDFLRVLRSGEYRIFDTKE
ncbi:MAG: PHP domain-containing protein [Oscillospiraceae bacterium]|nr:PHP domain-containing protein [Oscillospiraceae bacterium]